MDASPKRQEFRVGLAECSGYETDEVLVAVRKAVDAVGGIGCFVREGERILVKPNLLAARTPDEVVTTHPEVVRALIRLVTEAGATAVVGDSPAGRGTPRGLHILAEKTGMAAVCREEGVEFALFTESRNHPFTRGKVAKSFELTTVLDSVDGVISVSKMKTHTLTGFTGGVKNTFGLIPGLKKAEYHMRMQDASVFSDMLVDLAECVAARLNVMDAVVAMEGDGPASGDLRTMGFVAASPSPHALDIQVLRMTGVSPEDVWTVAHAVERGFVAVSEVVAVGDVPPLKTGFRMPVRTGVMSGVPRWLGSIAALLISRKPVFSAKACTRCGACVDICPAKALSMGGKRPSIDRGLCIRCYCCAEVCPSHAISLSRRPLRSVGDRLARATGVR